MRSFTEPSVSETSVQSTSVIFCGSCGSVRGPVVPSRSGLSLLMSLMVSARSLRAK
jgi:hypothetical protein